MRPNTGPVFRRSSFCGAGNCVEVAVLPSGDVDLRDSKSPELPPYRFSAAEWSDFVLGVKAGEFDFTQ